MNLVLVLTFGRFFLFVCFKMMNVKTFSRDGQVIQFMYVDDSLA